MWNNGGVSFRPGITHVLFKIRPWSMQSIELESWEELCLSVCLSLSLSLYIYIKSHHNIGNVSSADKCSRISPCHTQSHTFCIPRRECIKIICFTTVLSPTMWRGRKLLQSILEKYCIRMVPAVTGQCHWSWVTFAPFPWKLRPSQRLWHKSWRRPQTWHRNYLEKPPTPE